MIHLRASILSPERPAILRHLCVAVALALATLPGVAGAACECLNNATAIDFDANTGGADGQFSERIVVNAPDGQTWRVTANTGGFDAFNVPPVGTQSDLVPIPADGSVVLAHTAGTTMYTLDFVFIESLGYTITVENATGTSLGISNNCKYPNPEVSPPIASVYQPRDPAVTLGAKSSSGPPLASVTFTIDGAPATQLVPMDYSPPPATHSVELTAIGTDEGQFRACEQGARKSFSIIARAAAPAIGAAVGGLMLAALLGLGILRLRRV